MRIIDLCLVFFRLPMVVIFLSKFTLYKWAAFGLYAYFLLIAAFAHDSIVRWVGFEFNKNIKAPNNFINGLVSLNDALLGQRIIIMVLGGCLLMLVVFPPRK